MESPVKIKDIFILLLFSLIGVVVGVLITITEKEDIRVILENVRKEESIEVSVVEQPEVISENVVEEVVDPCPIRVDISGAVKNPGVYCLEADNAFVDAVKKSGGFANGVAQKYVSMRINLAQLLTDNSKLYIPYEEDTICEILEFKLPKEVIEIVETQQNPDQPEETSNCISINNANLQQLDTLDGIGPSTAQKIIDGRPYERIEDIINVSGIGQATYDKFKEKICL
jgi:competence protein ComEA